MKTRCKHRNQQTNILFCDSMKLTTRGSLNFTEKGFAQISGKHCETNHLLWTAVAKKKREPLKNKIGGEGDGFQTPGVDVAMVT